jgi:hypothetical protein
MRERRNNCTSIDPSTGVIVLSQQDGCLNDIAEVNTGWPPDVGYFAAVRLNERPINDLAPSPGASVQRGTTAS